MKLRDLAERLGCRLEGDGEIDIVRVATIQDAGPGDVTFLANPKYESALKTTRASAVLLREDAPPAPVRDAAHAPIPISRSPAPSASSPRRGGRVPGVHAMAAVAADARLGRDVSIGAFVVVGETMWRSATARSSFRT